MQEERQGIDSPLSRDDVDARSGEHLWATKRHALSSVLSLPNDRAPLGDVGPTDHACTLLGCPSRSTILGVLLPEGTHTEACRAVRRALRYQERPRARGGRLWKIFMPRSVPRRFALGVHIYPRASRWQLVVKDRIGGMLLAISRLLLSAADCLRIRQIGRTTGRAFIIPRLYARR
ncbi:hypothetical protein BV25DRAFT_939346 [Artomyces pyxidatus]|uniref:Uncharacterized protein n=1 Tax=Artomyces pyxidatus TaxID=48021 RepID=A0ACB8SXW3_9AGAM|nr:hypothetical protein BV25DRAFT_939346 [Artomyces pyxidatus]